MRLKMRTLHLRKRTVVLGVLIAILLLAAVLRIYAISEGAGLLVMWNQNEAYLFSQVDRRGNSSSYLFFPWVLFKEYVIGGFAGAGIPADNRAFLVVLHVTPAGVERHVVKLADRANGGAGSDPRNPTPIGGAVYAMWPGVHLCAGRASDSRTLPPKKKKGSAASSASREGILITTPTDGLAPNWERCRPAEPSK